MQTKTRGTQLCFFVLPSLIAIYHLFHYGLRSLPLFTFNALDERSRLLLGLILLFTSKHYVSSQQETSKPAEKLFLAEFGTALNISPSF